MENIHDDSEKLLSEKIDLMKKRSALLKVSSPLEWGEGTPKELVEINMRIKQIEAEIESLNE